MSDTQPDLGAMVSKILGNPELLSQIVNAAGINQVQSNSPQDSAHMNEEKEQEKTAGIGIDCLLPMLSSMGNSTSKQGGRDSSRRTALLSALRPFCNEHRCRTIDYMIGLSKLSETLMSKRG